MKNWIMLLGLLLVVAQGCLAYGGREQDNSNGKLDGNYRGHVKIHEPDKDEVTEADCKITVATKWVTLNVGDKVVKSHDATFYDYGYKLEIDMRQDGWRYLIQIDRAK